MLTLSAATAEYICLMIETKAIVDVLPLIVPGMVAALLLTGLVIKIGRDVFRGRIG